MIAFNLRLSISSASALLTRVQDQLGFGPLTMALIPTLPILCFAAGGACGAALARRWGTERAVLLALVVLCVGVAGRAVATTEMLLFGTALGAAGLALCNVLLPALVRIHFPERVARVTGLYTTAMALGSAVAAAAAVPVADVAGTPSLGLAAWALPAVLALVVWALCRESRTTTPVAPGARISAWSVGRTRFGLGVTAFFSLQALNSYAVIGWLPSMLSEQGLGSARAGTMLGVALAVGIPSTFALMPLTKNTGRLRVAFSVVGVALVAGYVGLLSAPLAAPVLWAVLVGVGMGAFPLVLAVIGSSGCSAEEATALSTFSQSTGYLVAAVGPFLVGLLHAATDGWGLPLGVLIALALLQLCVGLSLTTRHTAHG